MAGSQGLPAWPLRSARQASFLIATLGLLLAPLAAAAQEVPVPDTAPVAHESASPAASDPLPAPEGIAIDPAGGSPSQVDTDTAPTPTADAHPATPSEEAATVAPLDNTVAPEAPPSPEPSEPAPSFLEDPAGAVSHYLDARRDAGLPHDLSPWGMFMAADWVVKSVMIGLALASLGVWTVWLFKTVEIICAKARARRAVETLAEAASLADAVRDLSNRGGPAAYMVRSAESEMQRSAIALDHAGNEGVKERVGARLTRIEAQATRRLSRGTGLLATVGSVAPFIGLFGTVWGIMNSFIGISQAQTTNLAVVAPGIAEALLATAVGLVAAIPAVIVYNVFARNIAGYGQMLADAGSSVEQLVSLGLDLRRVPAGYPAGGAIAPAALAAE